MSRQEPNLPKHRKPCDLPSAQSSDSFWHKEPSALLKAHRSTRNLPETADVVIIGSGMTGASVAHHLFNDKIDGGKEIDVVLLEAREACWGATGRNGGHCQPILFEHPDDPSIGRFELQNFAALERLIREKDIDCEFVAQPGVRAVYSQHHLDETAHALRVLSEKAPDLAEMMHIITNKDELNSYRIPTALGAIVTNTAARMWPYKFVTCILEDLVTSSSLRGTFNLQTLTPVNKIDHDPTTYTTQVQTDRGTIQAKTVILATNGYTSHLLPNFSSLIVPCRGQMSALVPFPSVSGPSRLKTSLGFLGDGLDDYLIQRPNASGGHLMFGGGRQHGPSIGVTDDSTIDSKTAHYLRSRLVSVLNLPEGNSSASSSSATTSSPAPVEMDATHIWTGIMGYSRDEKPWVGAVPDQPGVFIAAGFTGHGMPNTWLCGKFVARLARSEGGVEGSQEDDAWMQASRETGMPVSYRVTRERMRRVLEEEEDVEMKDWAEMQRGEIVGEGKV